uniref:Nuclear factor, erythroid 2 n=1 Tax=Danio rerio TaxID=7955 RepID=A0ACD6B6D6_DANRE|nr:transcription factor NF-E2 45 kDa subunit isoform X1 [Danio rerio]XP_009295312.1 transcription factor NF-E2 45 kDa subunit isoform X1 [Danio rerio]|eukprot:XP_005162426.1 transcription factor NF-E2 45 kDa subunit isoform X1 [Danio rerio]
MCSAVSGVLPLRISCEGLPNPGRLHGEVSMSTNVTGLRTHRSPQNLEMDLAWQELMAITELQEFEEPNENPFEAIPYLSMEPMVSQGGFGMNQPQPESIPATCDAHPSGVYESAYPEMMPPYPHMDMHYGLAGGHGSSRMLANTQGFHPPLMSLLEHMNMTTRGHGIVKDGIINFHSTGQIKQVCTDDLESDSGLSLGSSPPLASPENAVHGVPAYLPTDISTGYAESESIGEQCRLRPNLHGAVDYQQSYSSYPGASFPTSANMPSSNLHTYSPVASIKQPVLPTALDDLQLNSSRVGSYQSPYPKCKSSSVPVPLSRDERRALALKIPFSLEKIVNLPVDDFNELLTQFTLNDAQLALVRDIRRRGKNKVAAQNCRKRKLENIVHLESELGQLRAQREHLARERLEFQQNIAIIKCRLSDLHTQVFSQLHDEEGHPYSVDEYSLQQTNDGNIYFVPRNAALAGE